MSDANSRLLSQAPTDFPPDFRFGCAASSYQIEGGWKADGKSESNWDVFCRKPGVIADGTSGEVACDHYHRFREDLDLMRTMGIGAYRLSISWPRVLPDGRGRPNEAGLAFYDRLIDGLLERGIEPWVTLFHWDMPQTLEAAGGFLNRDIASRMADYAALVAGRLGDRVHHWATINEGPCIAENGYREGIFAPGLRLGEKAVRNVIHHILLAHGRSVEAFRSEAPNAKIGFVHNPWNIIPDTLAPEDVAAAGKEFVTRAGWWLDPLFKGAYPAAELAKLGADAPDVQPGDLACIAQPLDFLGLNAYFAERISAATGKVWRREEAAVTDCDWKVEPETLYWTLRFLHEEYAVKELVVTENGCAWEKGGLEDWHRVAYIRDHLRGVALAISEKIPVSGYFVWSLLDNFEWASGYSLRFGMVHMDYGTLTRTPKASAHWYACCAREHHIVPDEGGVVLP